MKVDNPWGLVIVFSAFMIQVMSFGYSFSFGVYIVEFLHHFDTSSWLLALIGSINIGIFLGAGPFVSLLMRALSYRKVAMMGAILSSIGLLCMPFTPNVELLLLFYGVIAGFGFCLLYIPSHVLSGLYYDKHRSLATGIATAGSGLGSIFYPVLIQYLIDLYGWRGSMLILAGINMNMIWLSALLRPAPLQLSIKKTSEVNTELLPECENKNLELKNLKDMGTIYEEHNDNRNENETMLENISESRKNSLQKQFVSGKNSILQEFLNVLSFRFIIYWLNNLLWNFGGVLLILLAPDYFTHIGFTRIEASQLMSCIGIGSFIGCAIGGVVGNLPFINRIFMFILVNIGLGLEGFLLTQSFVHTLPLLGIVGGVLGFLFGLILGLLVAVTADLVGPEALGDAMGLLMLANGIGCIAGPPLGGKVQEKFGSQAASFYLGNSLNTLSGIVMLIIPVYDKFSKTFDKSTSVQK